MNTHSSGSLNLPSNRKFGFFFSAIFLLLALRNYLLMELTVWTYLFVALAAIFIATAILMPNFLSPLNKLWYQFGQVLGRIVSPIVLGLIFFLVISPVGLVTRAAGRDNLKLKKKLVNTYWVDRLPHGPSSESFINQY